MEFLASSKPNLIKLYNDQYKTKPYVEITEYGSAADEWPLTITGNDFELKIVGTKGGMVTSTSFNITKDGTNNPILSLAEAMKKNITIFYDVTTFQRGGKWYVRAYYDSSANYYTGAGTGLQVSGDFMGKYIPIVKYIMHYTVNDGESQFDAEKHTNDNNVSFNISNPFSGTIAKYPIKFNLSGYKSYNNSDGTTLTTPLGSYDEDYIVLPTTCGEFYELDYSNYFISKATNKKGEFLTNRFAREIGYGEKVAMSVICDDSVSLKLRVKYFTPSGNYINHMEDPQLKSLGYYFSETVNGRTDMYFDPAISYIESLSGKQVGYCEVVVMNGSTEVSEPMRLNVNGKCKRLNTIFFINKIGGVDWYSFSGSVENEVSISNNETYTSNYIGEYTHNTKHKTNVRYKTMEKMRTLNSGKISASEALWLEELASSKYCFILNDNDNYFYEIVVDDVDIETDSSEKYAEISITYYVGDKDLY